MAVLKMNNNTSPNNIPILRTLLNADYESTHDAMLNTTLSRIEQKKQGIITPDELWVVEHNDVYTLGQAGKEEHILQQVDTPIIHTDRGGQVTWHGKGQLVLYWLIDLNAANWSVRDMVSHAEQSIEDVLNSALTHDSHEKSFYAKSRRDAPGVYIYNNDDLMLGKIASLGFKIKHGFSYHGIALNLTCDLAVFNAINPCGYAGMQMLKLEDFVDLAATSETAISDLAVTKQLLSNIQQRLAGDIKLNPINK
ncbi:Octanoyltransferase [Psychrobacter piechaudii]|uniref:Octanoyltransferase n=2 Tax=Psychrobacter piechaudii TaxID=1945521 RepID=A0A1R4GXJ3_9GAMM|nr:Octanoyltransferase [Psychrobacter piechaudii]